MALRRVGQLRRSDLDDRCAEALQRENEKPRINLLLRPDRPFGWDVQPLGGQLERAEPPARFIDADRIEILSRMPIPRRVGVFGISHEDDPARSDTNREHSLRRSGGSDASSDLRRGQTDVPKSGNVRSGPFSGTRPDLR